MTDRFICDRTLGQLCKLLRMCGIDSGYCDRSNEISVIARRENRVILTRNSRFREKPGIFFIEPADPGQQLKLIINKFRLRPAVKLFHRCLQCNGRLVSIKKTRIQDRVPYYIYTHHVQFHICRDCRHIYWPGSHYQNMLRKLSKLKIAGAVDK